MRQVIPWASSFDAFQAKCRKLSHFCVRILISTSTGMNCKTVKTMHGSHLREIRLIWNLDNINRFTDVPSKMWAQVSEDFSWRNERTTHAYKNLKTTISKTKLKLASNLALLKMKKSNILSRWFSWSAFVIKDWTLWDACMFQMHLCTVHVKLYLPEKGSGITFNLVVQLIHTTGYYRVQVYFF